MTEDRLEALRHRFLARCREDLRWLGAVSPHLGEASAEVPPDLVSRAHSLAGAGGTFGFAAISIRARELEDALNDGIADRSTVLAALDALIASLAAETEER